MSSVGTPIVVLVDTDDDEQVTEVSLVRWIFYYGL